MPLNLQIRARIWPNVLLLVDPDKARGCLTNTVIIQALINWISDGLPTFISVTKNYLHISILAELPYFNFTPRENLQLHQLYCLNL